MNSVSEDTGHLTLVTVAHNSFTQFKTKKEVKAQKREINGDRAIIAGCSLAPCVVWSRRSSVTWMPKKASAPVALSHGFSTPFRSLKTVFFAASAFSLSPSPLLCCLPASFHTLIACISHRGPLANCIILMVFFMNLLCGTLTFHAAY